METLVLALERAQGVRGAEVVLLVRGGGSLEDLMAFNDERLARAIRGGPAAGGLRGRPRDRHHHRRPRRRPARADPLRGRRAGGPRLPPPGRRAGRPGGPTSARRRARRSGSSAAPSSASACASRTPRRSAGCPATARSWTCAPSGCGPGCWPPSPPSGAASTPPPRSSGSPRRASGWRSSASGWTATCGGCSRLVAAALAQRRQQVGARRDQLEALSPLSVLERGYSITMDGGERSGAHRPGLGPARSAAAHPAGPGRGDQHRRRPGLDRRDERMYDTGHDTAERG